MATKYIVDNLSGQTITGNLTINGNLSVTGVTTGSLATYRALLTQTGQIIGTSINDFNYKLIIGETYTIVNYVEDADFSNVANVQSGVINQTGCVFIATGATPNSWNDGTELSSGGGMIVDVLENTLGYDLEWSWGGFGPGTGVGYNTSTGPVINTFSRNVTYVTSQINSFTYGVGNLLEIAVGPSQISYVDDAIFVGVWDWTNGQPIDNMLYYTPIEISIKQDTDVTPIALSGTIESGFPIIAPAVDLFCNNTIVGDFYGSGEVDNIEELITELNTPQEYDLSFLGTYSDLGDGNILLTMKTNLKNQFCPTGTLTFEVYDND